MADGDGGIAADQYLRHRATDDLAAPDDAGARARDLNIFAHEQLVDAGGRARNQSGATEREPADVERVKAVHILERINCVERAPLVNLRRQRPVALKARKILPARGD